MAQPIIQTSFHAGEWAPPLNARVDLAKYHSAAALMRNFFVDYRGGASSCAGTKLVLQTLKQNKVRVIGFQPSTTIGYILEFGEGYIRFHFNGNPVLEGTTAVSAATNANPCVITIPGHSYVIGDWLFLSLPGMFRLTNRYVIISAIVGNNITISDLKGTPIDSTTFGAYTGAGTAQRVYTIGTPYIAADIALLKFTPNVNQLIITHPNYGTYILTLISATNWTLLPAQYGPNIGTTPSIGAATSGGSGTATYGYAVTAVDATGQEGTPGAQAFTATDITAAKGTITLTWTGVPGARSYNVYKTQMSYSGAIPTGIGYGFVGNVTGVSFIDTNIGPDFSNSPPILQNPFIGASVISLAITASGTYTTVPTVTIAAPGGSGQQATANAALGGTVITLNSGGSNHAVNDIVTFPNGIVIQVTATAGTPRGAITAFLVASSGSILNGATPANPISQVSTTGIGIGAKLNVTWGVTVLQLISGGAGYVAAPAVTFSAGIATATATIGNQTSGNPSVAAFFQQRLVLAAPPGAVQTFYMSQPGAYFNFNISSPIQPSDAITGSIVSGQLNAIRSMVSMPTGLILLTSQAAWLVNGGPGGAPITPIDASANSQAYNGASDVPPIVANYDIIYVQAKGSTVRDLSYNFYTNIYTGTDISVLSSHLFYGHQVLEMSYAEEPFKLIWAVRDDGVLLCLTYVKEQEIVGWTHRDTQGLFKSVASVVETISGYGSLDATYVVVQRLIQGILIQFVERIAERYFPNGREDSFCVDCALQTQPVVTPNSTFIASAGSGNGATITATNDAFAGANNGWIIRAGGGIAVIQSIISTTQVTVNWRTPMTAVVLDAPDNIPPPISPGFWSMWIEFSTFGGLDHLEGKTVTGTADGRIIPTSVITNGQLTLSQAASKVVIGLKFTPQLKTLALDLGEPTVQGKRKKITGVTVRCADSLGLTIGRDFTTAVTMKDLVVGNVGTMTNKVVSNLVTGDARTIIDPSWDTPGQYCIQQPNPYPATILGVIPEIVVGDGK